MIRTLKELREYLEAEADRFLIEEVSASGFDVYLPRSQLEFFRDELRRLLPITVSVKLYALPWWKCRLKKQQVRTADAFG